MGNNFSKGINPKVKSIRFYPQDENPIVDEEAGVYADDSGVVTHKDIIFPPVVLNSIADSFLVSEFPTENHGSDSSLELIQEGPSLNHVILKFDLSTLVSCSSAILKLRETFGGSGSFGVHPITKDWIEGQVTWNNAKTADPWSSAGGDYGTLITSKTVVSSADNLVDITSWVQSIISGGTNYGLICIPGASTNCFFASKENATVAYRPTLTVTP